MATHIIRQNHYIIFCPLFDCRDCSPLNSRSWGYDLWCWAGRAVIGWRLINSNLLSARTQALGVAAPWPPPAGGLVHRVHTLHRPYLLHGVFSCGSSFSFGGLSNTDLLQMHFASLYRFIDANICTLWPQGMAEISDPWIG